MVIICLCLRSPISSHLLHPGHCISNAAGTQWGCGFILGRCSLALGLDRRALVNVTVQNADGVHVSTVARAQKLSIPDAGKLCLSDFKFDDFSLSDDSTLCATARMFLDMDLINTFRIPYDVRPCIENLLLKHRDAYCVTISSDLVSSELKYAVIGRSHGEVGRLQ